MGALAIFPIAAALAVLGRKKFEETIFPAIGIIIITLMFAGMAGALRIGVLIIPVYVLLSIIFLIVNRKRLKKSVFTPGFLAYIVVFIFFIFFCHGRSFIPDAAMSQYGSVVRHLYEAGCIRNDTLYYSLYDPFPFASLWAYFCTYTIGQFSESACLFANDIFIISAVMPIFRYIKSVKKGSWQWLVLLLFSLLLPVLKVPEAYSSFDMAVPQAAALVYTFLMVDPLIPYMAPGRDVLWYEIYAAFGFFASCTLTKYGVFAAVPLMLGLCTASFSGVKRRWDYFVTPVAGCLATLVWGVYSYAIHEIDVDGLLLIPETCLVTVMVAVVISVLLYLYRKGYKKTVLAVSFVLSFALIWGSAFILRNSVNSEYMIDWIGEFTDKLFVGRSEEEYYVIGKRVIPVRDAAFLFILMMISGLACSRIEKKERSTQSGIFAFNTAYIVGSALYLVILCFLYVCVIRVPHAPVKPVTVGYIAPLILLSFSVVFTQAYKAWKSEWVLIVGVVILIACTYSDPVGAILDKNEREAEYPVIAECRDTGDLEFKGDDRVFYVDKDLIEKLPDSFNWSVFPAGADFINGLYFNPEPYKWNEDIKEPLTAEELADVIEEGAYTYVYLKNVDDFFWETYYLDFSNFGADIRNDALYRVEYDETGQLQIKFIAGADEEETEAQSEEE